jgi:hypothetical protein
MWGRVHRVADCQSSHLHAIGEELLKMSDNEEEKNRRISLEQEIVS